MNKKKVVALLSKTLHIFTLVVVKTIVRPDIVFKNIYHAVVTYRNNKHLWYFFGLTCWWCGEERRLYTENEQGTPVCRDERRESSSGTGKHLLYNIYYYIYENVEPKNPNV